MFDAAACSRLMFINARNAHARELRKIKPPVGPAAYIDEARRRCPTPSQSYLTQGTTMSNLTLLDPVFGNDFEAALRRFFSPSVFEGEAAPLRMRIDVKENDKAFTVQADIPGVKKEDIHVKIDGNVVRIDAESKNEKESKGNGDKILRSERYYGSVSRTFSLGQDVDDTKVQAKYVDGVLTLELPKKAPAASSKIIVQ
jgi:HSP20 family protein